MGEIAPIPLDRFPVELLGSRRGQPPDSDAQLQSSEGSEKQPFVLIVDDETDTLEALAELLEGEGIRSVQAKHGGEALELLRAGLRPTLILLDIKMPVMDGNEFLRRISAEPDLAEIPIAIVTASVTPQDVPLPKKDAGFFRKPVNYERLVATIRFHCG